MWNHKRLRVVKTTLKKEQRFPSSLTSDCSTSYSKHHGSGTKTDTQINGTEVRAQKWTHALMVNDL